MIERRPAVAGRFYPAEAEPLRATLEALCASEVVPEPALALIGPHAGYVFSGRTAGRTWARVEVPAEVIVLGPNHTGQGARLSLYPPEGRWLMPLGAVQMATTLGGRVRDAVPGVTVETQAHAREHGIEVHVPFMQLRAPEARLVALVTSDQSLRECEAIGQALAEVLSGCAERPLLTASTDMTHFLSAAEAERLDRLALERVLALDPAGLYETVRRHRISMCGVVPTTIVLFAALAAGARTAELVEYTHSGTVTGDLDSVVGYAGAVIR